VIAQLRGKVINLEEGCAIIETGGVGFAVFVPLSGLRKMKVGEEALLFTELQFREDDVRLFGFLTRGERNLFRTLRSVKGVGVKTALDILSTLPVERFCQAVVNGDLALIATAPGVGKKTAERLVFELRDKVDASLSAAAPFSAAGVSPQDDAIAGMIYLGYQPQAASIAVARARSALDTQADTETVIREALKHV
jgi:holliday junction DNA helicase RuvA